MDVNRMLKKATSGVLSPSAPSRTQTYVPEASLPRALLDGLFEHPVVGPIASSVSKIYVNGTRKRVLQQPVKVGLVVACFVSFGIATGCSLEPESLRVNKSANLQGKRIKTIAILPVESAPSRGTPSNQPASKSASSSDVDSGALLTDMLYSEMRRVPRWAVIPQPRIQEASRGVKELDGEQARKIGQRANADAVLFGRVSRYRERSGRGWGSDQPASVAFNLFLVDTSTGKSIWSARFDETQQALSENLLNVGKFFKRKTRFVRADELAREGVTNAVVDLEKALGPAPK